MTGNRNKLRQRRKGPIIYTAIIMAVLFIGFMLYATYIYLDYTARSGTTGLSAGQLTAVANALGAPQDCTLPVTPALILTLFKLQVTKLWGVYASAAFFVFIAVTSKNPNDEYKGMEHGSAKWADKYDEVQFRDITGIPIALNFYCSINNPKKKFYLPHNFNEIVIGGSGAGKSFRKIKPDIMQMFGSYVVTDPKGELYRDCAKFLIAHGYKVRVLNLMDISLSNAYNPFVYMTNEQDVLSVADLFMKNTAGENDKEDFWTGSAQDLLVAIMVYLFKSPSEIKSFGRVIRILNSVEYDKNGRIDSMCELARCMERHKIEHPGDVTSVNWASMQGTPQETMGGICKTLSTRLRLWAVRDVDELTDEDEMDFDSIGTEKTAVFLIIPAARQTYRAIANIFYSQLFERLMYCANYKHNGRLPYLVSCELDEFANIGKIPNFNETLAVVRSHNIRLCIVLQGLSQLKALYEKTWESIIGNCSLFTYLGTNDMDTKKYVVERLGKTTVRTATRSHNRGGSQGGGGGSDGENYSARDLVEVGELARIMRPRGKSKKVGGFMISFIDEFLPFFVPKFDTLQHPLIGETGSSFPAGIPNNTDIAAVYGAIKEERSKKFTQKQTDFFAASEAARQQEEQQQEQEKTAEKTAMLSELTGDGAEDFRADTPAVPQSPVPDEDDIEEEFEMSFGDEDVVDIDGVLI